MKLSLKKDIDDLKPAEVCVIFASEEQMKNPFNTAPQSVRDASSHIELELVQSKPGSCSLLPSKTISVSSAVWERKRISQPNLSETREAASLPSADPGVSRTSTASSPLSGIWPRLTVYATLSRGCP